jgi:hypothetical protein
VAEITEAFECEHGVEGAQDIVSLALDLLAQDDLLDRDPDTEDVRRGMSRRAALAAAAGLVVLPLVTTLAAPAPAQIASGCGPCSVTCGGGTQICNGVPQSCNTMPCPQ